MVKSLKTHFVIILFFILIIIRLHICSPFCNWCFSYFLFPISSSLFNNSQQKPFFFLSVLQQCANNEVKAKKKNHPRFLFYWKMTVWLVGGADPPTATYIFFLLFITLAFYVSRNRDSMIDYLKVNVVLRIDCRFYEVIAWQIRRRNFNNVRPKSQSTLRYFCWREKLVES